VPGDIVTFAPLLILMPPQYVPGLSVTFVLTA